MFTASLGAITALAFIAGIGMYLFHVGRKWAPWAFLVAGIGVSGLVGAFAARLSQALMDGMGRLMGVALGTTVTFGLVVLLGIYLYSRMWAKREKAGIVACVMALAFPSVLVGVGLGAFVAGLGNVVSTTGSTVSQILGGLGG